MLKWTHDYGTDRSEASTRRGKYVIGRGEGNLGWWETQYIPKSSRDRQRMDEDDYVIAYEPKFVEAMRAAEEHHAEQEKPFEW